jgi:hypothetical protein
MIGLNELRDMREWGLLEHQTWKARITLSDAIAAGEWSILWPDQTIETSEPLVENVYTQAIEDKMAAAGTILPRLFVFPTRGTRNDRAETNAQARRRVFASYWERSGLRRSLKGYYLDWLHTGAVYTVPEALFWDRTGRPLPTNERFPYLMRLDARQAYPLTHDSLGNLTSVIFSRRRRLADLQREYGENHPSLERLARARLTRGQNPSTILEELWYYDDSTWAVAFADAEPAMSTTDLWRRVGTTGGAVMDWAVPPEKHRLPACPVTEAKRLTHDGAYRGALEDTIPQLKTANNFMARILEDLNANIFAPALLDNVANPEEYAPGAVLVGTGEGAAKIERDRPPVNFEALNVVRDLIEQARRQGFEPQQRAGDAGASIVSAKGVVALAGTFNAELAWSQTDIEALLQRSNSMTAAYDEAWCYGTKTIDGVEGGREFSETYDPARLFKGDYRNHVTYGDRTGLDEQNHLVRLATAKQLGGMSQRTFMERAGIVEDVLQEERDMAIENLTKLFFDGVLPQQIAAGDLDALRKFVGKIDTDKMTTREAVIETINEMLAPAPGPLGGVPGGGGPEGPADVTMMARSLASGGIPGNAAGLPMPGPQLQRALPAPVARTVSEAAPGGTAA